MSYSYTYMKCKSLFIAELFFFLFTSTPEAYGSSQARDQIRAVAETYTTACGNTGSLTHWVRPGIDPHPYRDSVRFLTLWATMGTPRTFIIAIYWIQSKWLLTGDKLINYRVLYNELSYTYKKNEAAWSGLKIW